MVTLSLGDKYSIISLHHIGPNCSRVKIHAEMRDALADWTSTTRISPLFGVKEHSTNVPTCCAFSDENTLIFLGPHSPLKVSRILDPSDKLWLSYGLFNCVVLPGSDEQTKFILEQAVAESFRFEAWNLKDGEIKSIVCSELPPLKEGWNAGLTGVSDTIAHPEIKELIQEYCPLMATSLARSSGVSQRLNDDLTLANSMIISDFLNLPADAEDELIYRLQGELVNINSGLSRLSSQAFSGSIPIVSTECHFWSHSLLGTGVANLALSNISSAIRSRLGPMRIPKRIENLKNPEFRMPPGGPLPKDIQKTVQSDDFWDGGILNLVTLDANELKEPLFPQFSFFSGRDGFRATPTTLSAPLASVTSCNSIRWSLMTLSHEISHIVINAILGKIVPPPNDTAQLIYAAEIISSEPSNYFDSAKKFLLLAIIGLHHSEIDANDGGEDRELGASDIGAIIDEWLKEVEEIIVHVFDYSFFFDNLDDYISSIWLSWGVIPNISNRISEYTMRSLCVALTHHLRRNDDLDAAKEDIVRILENLRDSGDGGNYVKDALSLIDNCWESRLKPQLRNRKRLVKFARGFLYWPGAESSIRKDKWIQSQKVGVGGYPHKRKVLSAEPLNNPIRFAKEFSSGLTPDTSESLWLLLTIAYNYDA